MSPLTSARKMTVWPTSSLRYSEVGLRHGVLLRDEDRTNDNRKRLVYVAQVGDDRVGSGERSAAGVRCLVRSCRLNVGLAACVKGRNWPRTARRPRAAIAAGAAFMQLA